MSQNSSPALRVAVVGDGAMGMCAAQELLNHEHFHIAVDLISPSPAPFGLLSNSTSHATAPLRLLGNVHFGTDLVAEDLREFYDAIVFASGAPQDRDTDTLLAAAAAGDLAPRTQGRHDAVVDKLLSLHIPVTTWEGSVALDVDWAGTAERARKVPTCI
ncbi:hypothetical protein CATRI_12170 [Corynebacterium atrinae]|uniref:hypothetical protein n=1 Tax=Corynebacterium atrinae TaxID=1336740 RepID=UPI0025B5F290|nr:hypothetical protein [Corynebacterium atrinae]WJY64483.1 hypothetical protein CATRI_12170 [Corynebacterium atrinae]